MFRELGLGLMKGQPYNVKHGQFALYAIRAVRRPRGDEKVHDKVTSLLWNMLLMSSVQTQLRAVTSVGAIPPARL